MAIRGVAAPRCGGQPGADGALSGSHPWSGRTEGWWPSGFGWRSIVKPSVEWRRGWMSGLMAATGHGLVQRETDGRMT